ncbi:P-loop containing nucleoside triphosphate hydrolase protein [Roridomyces roridus]|uniref:P-loop containing nucleoside triphosphate hydrolase protein n=1 Tax=Roridomyces roridus TaxID=1738132 RepID=A0AAD7CB94_9AGAR|nr:P-loop containing nucleoside triphosphate hydrolase protein [Roridomyces roridus]
MKLDSQQKGSLIEEVQLGVWRILIQKETSSAGVAARWSKFKTMVPTVQRHVAEVVALAPVLISLIFLSKLWTGLEDVLLLHLSGRILTIIEVGIKEGRPDVMAIVNAVVARMLVVSASATVEWWRNQTIPIVSRRVLHHYEDFIFSANLEKDLTSVHANNEDISLNAKPVWDNFTSLMDITTTIIQVVTLLAYIFHVAVSSRHGPVFVLLCLGRPLMTLRFRQYLWEKVYVAEAVDPGYLRLRALRQLSEDKYRQDIISGNIGDYVLQEFTRAREQLGDTETRHPQQLYGRKSLSYEVTVMLLGNLTMLYYAAISVLNPSQFTLTSIATLQHSESILQKTFYDGMRQIDDVRLGIDFARRIYALGDIANSLKDGSLEYPRDAETAGMAIELKNVSFSYPGSKSNVKALNDVTFSIKAGQLVVLVGENGSGKSTIVKLLARLYDATEGQILVDGNNIQDYKMADLRKATASLTQDHHLYPLSLSENIGLGNPARASDHDLVREAAKKGGAEGFLSKLKEGFSTILEQYTEQYTVNINTSDKTPLAKEAEKLKKTADISGGERQRIVASRTFMRFTSGAVKLMIADEGSSALDPEGEWELFKNLREERAGKSMVFVTHRFGHLTKYADMILCMKDGNLVESGTHEELIKMGGEYFKLYDVQAKAFDSEKAA